MRLSLALMIFALTAICPAHALSLGEAAGPVSFETLDGHPRTMDNYADRAGTVVVFLSGRCDTTIAQFPAINAVHEKYRQNEVLFVGVVSNPAESGDELRTFSQNLGCRFPIYREPSGATAKKFGATVTPSFYLLDATGKLLYHGGLGTESEGLESAIVALLAKEPVKVSTTTPTGTPITKPGAKRAIPDPYGTMSFSSELIFTKIPDVAVHHCSTITEAPNGDMLCLWYAGSYESADDQALYLARLPKGKRIWTTPERIVWNPETPPGNAIIFATPDKHVWIIWGRMEGSRPTRRGSGWSQCRLIARTSSDSGKTWTEDAELPNSFGWLPRNAPLTLKDGRFALPVSGDVDSVYAGFLLVLEENNRSWKRIGLMPGGEQPTVFERDNGELVSLMRGHPRILQSASKDGGNTWTTPEKTDLNCPESGIAVTKLRSGRILLAYNNTPEWDRTPFNIIQSTDDGKTWGEIKIMEQDWGEFSYPCIIQSSDGMVHLTYTYRRFSIKHATFDEGWLKTKERPN
ncbi:MAG: exo-alpha-sialidase [Candidatus Hydrogenedentes bacterium]|nr:exo-alpha-sialidase [Candidatus Hydrogenedentota bacterium]